MSIIRKYEEFNEECVFCFASEGDARLYMPLCGITHCHPDYFIERRMSSEYVFEYIVHGHGLLHIGNKEYNPGPDDAYILHKGSSHYYRTSSRDLWMKIWFNIQGTLIDELMQIYNLENVNYIPNSGLKQLFYDNLSFMRENLDNAHEAATITAHRLVYGISKQLYNGIKNINPIALELKKWLEKNVIRNISLSDLSKVFGYSESQLIRIFQAEYGETPYSFFEKETRVCCCYAYKYSQDD